MFINFHITSFATEIDIDYIKQVIDDAERADLFSTVYVTDTGYAYHEYGCYYLNSKNKMLLINAIEEGYIPCTYCNPPNIPKSYYEFKKLDTYGNIDDTVYLYGNSYHRKDCPKLIEECKTCSLIDACLTDIERCKYCNAPKLSYGQLKEYKESQRTWWDKNGTITLVVGIPIVFAFLYILSISMQERIKSKKNTK